MKVKKILILIVLLCVFSFTKVNAEGPFYFEWETKDTNVSSKDNLNYKNNYVFIDSNNSDTKTIITIYDKEGKELHKVEIPEEVFTKNEYLTKNYSAMVINDNLYIVTKSQNDYFLRMYDSELKELKKIKVGFNSIFYYQDKLLVPKDTNNYLAYDLDLTNSTDFSMTSEKKYEISSESSNYDYAKLMNYFNTEYTEEELSLSMLDEKIEQASIDVQGEKLVYGLNLSSGICKRKIDNGEVHGVILDNNKIDLKEVLKEYKSATPSTNNQDEFATLRCYNPTLGLLDKDYKKVWTKELIDYYMINEVRFLGEYIGVVGIKEDSMDIIIYDLKGNEIQKFNSPSGFYSLTSTERGFIVNQGTCAFQPEYTLAGMESANQGEDNQNSVQDQIIPFISRGCTNQDLNYNHQVYYIFKDIKKDIKGKGTVEITNQEIPGEPVVFKITPEKGYVLGAVKVIDANGNTITFTQNTFTMPSSNITIEVEFVLAEVAKDEEIQEPEDVIVEESNNPETADIAIISVAALALLSIVFFFKQRKKLKDLS